MQFEPIVPPKTPRAAVRGIAGLVATALLLPFVVAAWRSALGAPLLRPLHVVLTRLPTLFPIHMAAAGAALLLVPLALASVRVPRLHRAIGRLAALAIGLGGATALVVAAMSAATPLARAGFLVQGFVWLGLTAAGVRAIVRKRRTLHARLMTAAAIVTVSPVFLRLGMYYAVVRRMPFASTYAALAWLVWLVPLACYLLFALRHVSVTGWVARQLEGTVQAAFPE